MTFFAGNLACNRSNSTPSLQSNSSFVAIMADIATKKGGTWEILARGAPKVLVYDSG